MQIKNFTLEFLMRCKSLMTEELIPLYNLTTYTKKIKNKVSNSMMALVTYQV